VTGLLAVVLGCTCEVGTPPDRADAVFAGVVTHVDGREVDLEIRRAWRGARSGVVELDARLCQHHFVAGRPFVVLVARRADDGKHCWTAWPLDESCAVLEELGQPLPRGSELDVAAAGVGVVAALLAGAQLLMRSRRAAAALAVLAGLAGWKAWPGPAPEDLELPLQLPMPREEPGAQARVVAALDEHGDGGRVAQFDPTGARLATSGAGRSELCLWDVNNGERLECVSKGVPALAWGDRLRGGGARWKLQLDPKSLHSSRMDTPRAGLAEELQPSTAGDWLVRVRTGVVLERRDGGVLPVGGVGAAAAFSQDGSRLAVAAAGPTDAGGWQNAVRLLSVETGAELARFARTCAVGDQPLRLDARGETVVWLEARTIAIGSADGRRTLPGGGRGLALSPDGRRLAVGGDTLRVLDARTGRELLRHGPSDGGFLPLEFSPDGGLIVVGQPGGQTLILAAP